jgi:hypothetical protein
MRVVYIAVLVGCGFVGRARGAADCKADGTVVNALTGAPIPNARVTLRTPGESGSVAGPDGKWQLAGISCGVVQFTAFRAGFITGIYGSHGPVSDPRSEEAVLVESGSVTHGLEIQLFPGSVIVGNVRNLLARLSRIDVLVIDDWAMAPLSEPERRDFWEICEDRYQVRSLILTSQLPVTRWHEQIGDPTVADGILDRLVHNAHRIEMRGDSMRKNRKNGG